MSFDPLVANPGRLEILTALATEQRQEFTLLRRRTRLTDGNLACHARRLQTAGLIEISKQFREGKPTTSYILTDAGMSALQAHVTRLMQAISRTPLSEPDRQPIPDLDEAQALADTSPARDEPWREEAWID